MLWVYDNAIVKDLSDCINPDGGASNAVKLMGDEGMMGVLAQIQDDKIKFPTIFLKRHDETPIDQQRTNFTRLHKGVATTYDPEKNNVYVEKVLPIDLRYDLHVLATNTADSDEIMRELLFRYSSMYYITTEVPYESKRKIRFGVAINKDTNPRRTSGASQYIESGTLYDSTIELICEGAVLISYTARHMNGVVMKQGVELGSAKRSEP